jgi:hypothetical protein
VIKNLFESKFYFPPNRFVQLRKSFTFASASNEKHIRGPVVQLVRMPACHAGGREFESRPDRKQSLSSQDGRLFCF